MTGEERVQRAIHAQALKGDTVLQEAFATADARYVQEWREADTPEEREAAHAKMRALQHVQRELDIIVADGQHAEYAARRSAQRAQGARREK